jgi:Mn2+/Fe2+ NRAMP family transporter
VRRPDHERRAPARGPDPRRDVVALPLTYLPILLDAGDREVMGEHVNGALARILGWAYFALICVLTVAAPILLLATNGGGG